eukprot:217180_1
MMALEFHERPISYVPYRNSLELDISDIETSHTIKYCWKIPSINKHQKQLICHGYVRQHYNKYVITPIIQLFAMFYSNQDYILQDIKNAENGEPFSSPIFSVESFRFYLELYPNGGTQHTVNKVLCFLCLPMMPPHLTNISTKFNFSLIETNTKKQRNYTFDGDRSIVQCIMMTDPYPLKHSDLQNLNSLTLNLTMQILSTTDQNNNSINYSSTDNFEQQQPQIAKSIQPLSSIYRWNINEKSVINKIKQYDIDQCIDGPVIKFGAFKFYFRFSPYYRNKKQTWFGIMLFHWPIQYSKALFKCKVSFVEIDAAYSGYKALSENMLWYGRSSRKSENIITELTKITIDAEISVIETLDINGHAIDFKNEHYGLCNFMNLPKIEYVWRIDDEKMIENMKSAPNVHGFESEIFEAFGMKWYLSFWPNGSRLSRKGNQNLFVHIIPFANKDMKVIAKMTIIWVENDNNTYTNYKTFKRDDTTDAEFYAIDIKNMNSFTFIIQIQLVEVIYDDEVLTDKHSNLLLLKEISVTSIDFDWNICNKTLNCIAIGLSSPIFCRHSIDWELSIYPDGQADGQELRTDNSTDLWLGIRRLPFESAFITARYIISVKETNTRYIGCETFYAANPGTFWGDERLSADVFKKLNSCHINVKIDIIQLVMEK